MHFARFGKGDRFVLVFKAVGEFECFHIPGYGNDTREQAGADAFAVGGGSGDR